MHAAAKDESVLHLAASLLSQNPPPGLRNTNAELRRVIELANSLNASGLAASLYDDGRRSRSTSKERDSETGLDYFGARYFGSALGRWTSPDEPFADQYAGDPQSWNLYGYARNNPLRNFDMDGRTCSHSKGSNGGDIIVNLDGNGCAELYDNTVRAYDNSGLAMLAGLGENLNEVSAWTNVARRGVEGAALFEAGLEAPGLLKTLGKGFAAFLEGGASTLLRDTEGLVDAATAADPADKGGLLTKAARALQKHAARAGSRFPQATGNPSTLNQRGAKYR